MLNRSITPLHATALVVGIIIGASIFVQPSVITGTVPTLGAVYLVWIVSGILTLFGALIAAELAAPAALSATRRSALVTRFFQLDGHAAERAVATTERWWQERWTA
jgi:cytochrome c biogenesis protein CcdA